MVYILETEISKKKSLIFSLKSIYGLGESTSRLLCRKLGYSENLALSDLSQDQIAKLVQLLQKSGLILTHELKKVQVLLLKHKVSIKSYRGLRYIRGLPVRGQRTHTNAKTAKRLNKGK
jgi:small subunit ribosomal protein S13